MAGRRLRGSVAAIVLTLLAAASLAACAAPHGKGGAESLPFGEWQEIDIAQEDLTLTAELPLTIASLYRRSDTKFAVQDYYRLDGRDGVEGYILTLRNPGASLPDSMMLEMRQARLFHAYARRQPETRAHGLDINLVHYFPKRNAHTVGHYTTAPYPDRKGSCFFARIGFLLSGSDPGELPPGAIDTYIQAMLCGDPIDEAQLVAALEKTQISR